jgi:hypothetical protein
MSIAFICCYQFAAFFATILISKFLTVYTVNILRTSIQTYTEKIFFCLILFFTFFLFLQLFLVVVASDSTVLLF